tara:strand:+ start:954 stop:1118 length:165 start_codon:yes stop_codon:yes gene_type:complete
MNLRINLIEDRGFSKTLHFAAPNSNEVMGYVTVGESHPWFEKEVGDHFTLSDHI